MDDTAKPIARPANVQGRHSEIAHRYAWQAKQQRKRDDEKHDQSRLITLIRLRELERLFKHRYGRFLPDDDAGQDDLVIAVHHIAFLCGEVREHIVAWAPWMPKREAEALADRVAAAPRKFTAEVLAWRLRLSMAERMQLRITTIGAFDVDKAGREAIQRERKRERDRARRARNSSGRPRGRPRKNARHAGIDTIAGRGFSPTNGDAARETPETCPDATASKEENQIGTIRAAEGQLVYLGEAATAEVPSINLRAAPPQRTISSEPPPEVIEKAIEMARDQKNSGVHFIGRREALRLIKLYWPGYLGSKRAMARRYYGRFDPKRDLRDWTGGFKYVLDREYEARQRYRERRKKWQCARQARQQQRERQHEQLLGRYMTKQSWLAEKERREKADAALAVRDQIVKRRAERIVRDLYACS